jgi:hypothetical protein
LENNAGVRKMFGDGSSEMLQKEELIEVQGHEEEFSSEDEEEQRTRE